MKKTVIAMIVFSVFMVGTLTYIGLKYEEQVKDYNALENDMVEAAQIYLEFNDLGLSVGETFEIPLNQLVEDDLISSSSIEEDECDGYVKIKKNFGDYEYNSYIKCESYTTVDYEKN